MRERIGNGGRICGVEMSRRSVASLASWGNCTASSMSQDADDSRNYYCEALSTVRNTRHAS